ncbi:MAG TPA: hypothetical protein VJ732_10375 [Bryobacteraceae bacterium]|nr:hypothetical protein [Bryobacteraceae bacterium]
MFTADQRAVVRSKILARAAADPRIQAAAITGSASAGTEDEWSDIDLAFAVADGVELMAAVSDWTAYMYEEHAAIHHLDVPAGAWLYRVFLLPRTLQADLAFVPAAEFRPLAPTFKLVFGTANEPGRFPPPSAESLIGLGWLYALHARGCIARARLWQAEYMVQGLRNQALVLACIRHNLPAVHGRGIDQLPAEITAPFESGLVQHLDRAELTRAFRVVVDGFLSEVCSADERLGNLLRNTLAALKQSLG